MATACPPPPPLPPPCANLPPPKVHPPPRPAFAAIPFRADGSSPVQETSPPPETQQLAESPPAPPLLPVQNGAQFQPSQGQEDSRSTSHSQMRDGPVQETEPAPQTLAHPDDRAAKGDNHSDGQD